MRMKQLFRALSLVLAVSLLGALPGCAEETRIPALTFADRDIAAGYEVGDLSGFKTGRFNRISFTYTASAPVKVEIICTGKKGAETTEELLLSEKETQASLLLDGFLDKATATGLRRVRFSPLREGPCTLGVSDFTCDRQTVPDKTVYLENGRFRLGVTLDWGGAIGELTDKTQKTYGNLLNRHDTGRLVQQSFYGPTEIEGYENGSYGGGAWGYNPVQGGDQFGNKSKLVRFEQTEDRIRIVSRPMDWAKNNAPTMTYYTNEYTLTEDGVRVENSVIDFLNTPWTPRHQELPAFYTVSALGTFVFYDGDKPWTDDALRYERDLPFWGGNDDAYFTVRDGNTETWCAWVDDGDYGVGLFTPGAEILLAGRFEFNGSKSAEDNATNYVAPLRTFALEYGEPFSYTYYLTAGSLDEIRQTFRRQAQ